ncbi:DUF1553 domain-containing protein [Rudanella paleaurantiibacter]|uniref:DUF1553 domain-containing protein n=1 Tax=Rudanella paleaurantiibacter TaxID=2614655 RepID=A0A7J5U0J4_9BACT|nr:DUF1553 domain-containing protein [Rudanella paleaurantiibacter]KAB7731147.1 DUF1553 domain-containing protein [Rudanella paleaurantiibacter]
MKTWIYTLIGLAGLSIGVFSLWPSSDRVDYNTQIKPILNKHCIACHGGVKQAGGLSLLFREEALAKTKSGHPAIIPGDARNSEFIKRLTDPDPEERMPYKADPLKPEEIQLLTRWVDEGCAWDTHWAYRPLERPAVPGGGALAGFMDWFLSDADTNAIDKFVAKRHEEEGLSMAPEADRLTLIRRVSLDLTGLPPTAEQLKKYSEADDWDTAYAQLVDELLASSGYGERWAAMWLDLARYADSRGYQKDNGRSIWPYRDWVIRAFNADMPFDRFTTEQLAGDLLAQRLPAGKLPPDDLLIATGFHRNTMNNDETGTVDEEFRVAALIDRVNTTWEAWQGTSFGCVQCHSHPYDPFRHEDYYKFMAFFNNTRDEDTQDEAPFLRQFKPEDESKAQAMLTWLRALPDSGAATSARPYRGTFNWVYFLRHLEPRHHAHYADNYEKGALLGDRNIGLKHGGSCRLPNMQLDGRTQLLTHLSVKQPGGVLELHLDSPTGPLLSRIKLDTTRNNAREKVLQRWPIKPTTGRHDLYLTATNPGIDPESYFFQIDWFALIPDFPGDAAQQQAYLDLIAAKTNNTPIMLPTDPDYARPTHLFVRGNWLSPGPVVQPDVPKSLGGMNRRLPKDRLGLAQWLTDPNNPLTARVTVNRFWEQLFGVGLVETLEDFGTAGAKPSHPELLDYLAVRFSRDWGWSMKQLLRYMVLSKTYRQSSKATPDAVSRDPQNRLLARGARLRLPAETIRDQALAVSGLLSRKAFGKPTMPYQPDGIWQAVNSSLKWEPSLGEDAHRRGIYTFVRRTGPYPSMVSFDAGSREVCLSRRIRTNTPLQALTLLNDPVFVEAADQLARLVEKHPTVEAQLADAYQRAIGRPITPEKQEALQALYDAALKQFRGRPDAKHAALSMATNALLNIDEFVTKS